MSGKIVYNGRTLTLPNLSDYEIGLEEDRQDNFGQGDPPAYESISFGSRNAVRITCKSLTRPQVWGFYDWWAWARGGNPFAFSLFDDKDRETSVTSWAPSGQTVICMTATSRFVAGDYCMVRQSSGTAFEVVLVSSVNTDVAIAAAANLANSYQSGDTIRHVDHWPNLITEAKKFPLKLSGPGMHQDITIDAIEVRSL